MITAEIAGYTLNGENKCPECVYNWALITLDELGATPNHVTARPCESLLDICAGLLDVDRAYADSNEFPVPFSGQQAYTDASRAAFDGEHAPRCQCGNDFTGEF